MTFYGKTLLLTGILMLAACQSGGQKDNEKSAYVPDDDMCGASDYQNYVGKPLSSVENLRTGTEARAIAHDSVVTMDFNLRRLNFLGDNQGIITRVYCG